MSPDISNSADCVQTSAGTTKKRQKPYMIGIKVQTKALLLPVKVALCTWLPTVFIEIPRLFPVRQSKPAG